MRKFRTNNLWKFDHTRPHIIEGKIRLAMRWKDTEYMLVLVRFNWKMHPMYHRCGMWAVIFRSEVLERRCFYNRRKPPADRRWARHVIEDHQKRMKPCAIHEPF